MVASPSTLFPLKMIESADLIIVVLHLRNSFDDLQNELYDRHIC